MFIHLYSTRLKSFLAVITIMLFFNPFAMGDNDTIYLSDRNVVYINEADYGTTISL